MATLHRWDPFTEMQRLTDQMFRGWMGEGERRSFAPPVNIYEENGAVYIRAELPGVKPDEVNISVENDVLTISGERKLERAEKHEGYHRVESSYGSFSRSFALPESVDPQRVDAELNDGILTLKLMKRAETAPKRIEVKPRTTTQAPRQVGAATEAPARTGGGSGDQPSARK